MVASGSCEARLTALCDARIEAPSHGTEDAAAMDRALRGRRDSERIEIVGSDADAGESRTYAGGAIAMTARCMVNAEDAKLRLSAHRLPTVGRSAICQFNEH